MATKNTSINFNGQSLFKLLVTESFTIPDTISSPSPTNGSSGVSPTTVFDAKRASVGGEIYAGVSDAAGSASPDDLHFKLAPGDIVALSAVASSKATLTINGETVAIIPCTAFAAVLGFWA